MDTVNRVLRGLPETDRREALDKCERVALRDRTILDRAGEMTSLVHFPESAVISTVATYSDGSCIEMANIGREACTGIGLVLEQPRQLNTNEVQIAGDCLQMPADAFLDLKSALPEFEKALLATVQAFFSQIMISGACNGRHVVKQRLARWLLTMRDRNDAETMSLTHELLAEMLGVRRATVTDTLQKLQSANLIESSRKEIRILDPSGLRRVSCECYDLVRNAYDSLVPTPKRAS